MTPEEMEICYIKIKIGLERYDGGGTREAGG